MKPNKNKTARTRKKAYQKLEKQWEKTAKLFDKIKAKKLKKTEIQKWNQYLKQTEPEEQK